MSYVDHNPFPSRTSHKLFGPSAFPDEKALFLILSFEKNV